MQKSSASLCFAIVAACCAPLRAAAQTAVSDGPASFGQALATWTIKHRIADAAVIVRREGKVIYTFSVGAADPRAPVHIYSLSKAITAACVATLVRDGKLTFETSVGTALKRFFQTHGKPADPRIEAVTIAQLVAHRAGFSGNAEESDVVTGKALVALLQTQSPKEPSRPQFLVAALQTPLQEEPGKVYAYGNTAYLLLGAIIEEASGQTYETYCRNAVLKAAGIDGALDPDWRVMSSYGGWRMTAEHYLTFLDYFDRNDTRLGPAARAQQFSPDNRTVNSDGSIWYGLGLNTRKAGAGFNVWHWGSWTLNTKTSKVGPISHSGVTLAVRVADGTGWFVAMRPGAPRGEARVELDRDMSAAYRAVKKWQ